jgi:uncharacterized membrane protein
MPEKKISPSDKSKLTSKQQFSLEKAKIAKKVTGHPSVTLKSTSFGDRASDWLTTWVGSWAFIFLFVVYLIVWIGANAYAIINQWDPFPFIFLNLTLSVLAAIQAPVILMSQNREAKKERIRSEYDYSVNRKAQREIEDIKKQLDRIERRLNK